MIYLRALLPVTQELVSNSQKTDCISFYVLRIFYLFCQTPSADIWVNIVSVKKKVVKGSVPYLCTLIYVWSLLVSVSVSIWVGFTLLSFHLPKICTLGESSGEMIVTICLAQCN